MIRSRIAQALLALAGACPAHGETVAPAPEQALTHPPDVTLRGYRTPIEALTERAIGRTSRRVRFDWRRASGMAGVVGGLPAEMNSFNSLRAGGFVRMPVGEVLLELAVSNVWVWGSDSTDKLALTPYRQPGRPGRVELDLSVAIPMAEGIVTARPGILPSAELVLNAYGQFRYLVYPSGFGGMGLKDTLKAIVSGELTDDEVAQLEDARRPGMEIDRGRYLVLLGIGNDLYFQSGVFVSHRVLAAVPLLRFMTGSKLDLGFELNLSTGVAF